MFRAITVKSKEIIDLFDRIDSRNNILNFLISHYHMRKSYNVIIIYSASINTMVYYRRK